MVCHQHGGGTRLRSLPSGLSAQTRLLIGLALAALGEFALTALATGTSWTRLLPGLLATGIGSGIVNAALGRIAVESVPADRVEWAAARTTPRATWVGQRALRW